MDKTVNVKYKKLNKEAVAPKMGKPGDACFDVAATSFEVEDGILRCKTGLAFQLPEGYEMQIRGRSGLGGKSITVAQGIGTLDSGYRGELIVLLSTTGAPPFLSAGAKQAKIGNVLLVSGDRVAQIAVRPVPEVKFTEVDELGNSERGEDGFGSTGLKAK